MATIKRRAGGTNPTTIFKQSYSTAFSPTSIAGCQLWLDAADTSSMSFSSGSNISQWRDKSGLTNHATAVNSPVLSANAINTYQAVTSTTNQYFTGSTSVTGTTVTVFAVALTTRTLPNASLDQRLVSLESGANVDYGRADGVIALFNQGGSSSITTWRVSSVAGSGIAQNVPFQVVSKYDGTNGFIWKNGSSGGSSASSGTFAVTKYGIGNQANPTAEYWIGSIGEVLIYNIALDDTPRQTIESYLAQKWGLTGSLPAGHQHFIQPAGKPNTVTNLIQDIFPLKRFFFSFNSFSSGNLTLVGNAILNGSLVQLTTTSSSQAGAAYYPSKVNITSFTSYFVMQFASTNADGATFLIQNSSSTAIGASGGGLGFSGVTPSVGFRLDTYNGSSGNFSTDIITNGSIPTDQAASGILNTTLGITAGGTWNFGVSVTYNGSSLSYTITNLDNTSKTYTYSGAVNIPSIVGGTTAWVGFTAATGGATETCSVSQWNFNN